MVEAEEFAWAVESAVALYKEHGALQVSDEALRRSAIRLITEWAELEWTLPTEPGLYADNAEHKWILHPDGSWTDRKGETRDATNRLFLVNCGPWTKLSA